MREKTCLQRSWAPKTESTYHVVNGKTQCRTWGVTTPSTRETYTLPREISRAVIDM